MTRSLSNTVRMSLGSMAEQLLCLMGTVQTKDCAHIWRSGGTIGVTVHLISSMALQTKKEAFLSNKHNKQIYTGQEETPTSSLSNGIKISS